MTQHANPTLIQGQAVSGRPAPDPDTAIAADWLTRFEADLGAKDARGVAQLFGKASWWRDLLALTWEVRTFHGQDEITSGVNKWSGSASLREFALEAAKPPKRGQNEAGAPTIETSFRFEGEAFHGRGVLRLVEESGDWRAWTFLTAVDELIDHQESLSTWDTLNEPHYTDVQPGRMPWAIGRQLAGEFDEGDVPVLIVGAGQAGLTMSARLARLGTQSLVIDRTDRLGNSWRNRYSNLQLHDTYWNNTLPYIDFPATWPVLSPKDKMADWIESYANHLDIPVWLGTTLDEASYDGAERRWSIRVTRQDGTKRRLTPRHLVMATGMQNTAFIPALTGKDDFEGEIYHSTNFPGGPDFAGRRAVVVGAGNSAHDIIQDLYEQGADTTMVQRGDTWVMSTENGIPLLNAGYGPGLDVEEADLWGASLPFPLSVRMSLNLAAHLAELDKDLLDGLRSVGFKLNFEGPGRGVTKGGGFYFDQGACQLLVDRKVDLVDGAVVGFGPKCVLLSDGRELSADLVVLATGYRPMNDTLRELLGDEIADRISPIWGLDEERHEISGLWSDSGHPHLWVHGGNMAMSRVYSKYLSMRIAAEEHGLLG